MSRQTALAVFVATALTSFGAGASQIVTDRGPGGGKPANPSTVPEIDRYLTRLAAFGFTGGVLLAMGEKVVLEKGYGLADRKRGLPFTKDTVFDIGSNTKDLTKTAILQLADKKRLALDDSIAKFFDNVPADKRGITVQHLLDHTAGLGLYVGRDEGRLTKSDFLAAVFRERLRSEPGTTNAYSNPGYSVLAAIIENVSGQTYDEYLKEHILTPAGMKTTGYVLPKWADGQITRNYQQDEERPSTFDYAHLPDGPSWTLRGNGGTLSTLGDMFRYHLAMVNHTLLTPAMSDKVYPSGRPVMMTGGNGVHYFVYQRQPASGVVLLMATTDSAWRATSVNGPVLALARGENVIMPPEVIPYAPGDLAKFAGDYKLSGGAQLKVEARGTRLAVSAATVEGLRMITGVMNSGDARNEQAKAMVEAAARGDYALVQRAFGDSVLPEQISSMERSAWDRRRTQFGAFRSATVLGTTGGPGPMTTIVRLEFEKGAEFVNYMWGGGLLRGIRASAATPVTMFLPISPTRFVSFSVPSGAAPTLEFVPTSAGGFIIREAGLN